MEAGLIVEILNNPDYGWLGWASVLVVMLSFVVGFVSKQLITIAKNIAELHKQFKKPAVTDYKKQVKCEANISGILRTIKRDLHADTVMIWQYHNGVHSIANNSLLRVSATHESINQNGVSYLGLIDGWMANFLGDWNNELFDGRYIECARVPELHNPSLRGLVQYLERSGVKSIYLFPLADVYGAVFGVGVVCYSGKEHVIDSAFLKWAGARFTAIGAMLAGVKND